jgi:hypothetical protein
LILEPNLAFDWPAALPALEDTPAVYLIHLASGQPYLGRTQLLRRRLKRLLEPRPGARLLNLGVLAQQVQIWLTPTRLEQLLTFYGLAKTHFPDTYRKVVRLPHIPYVKLLRNNAFPRTQVTTRLAGRENLFFGPFRNRAEAERWERETLEFFQLRRCEEELAPHPDHPGCIYGEMNQCLRPCQMVVGPEEYSTEVARLEQFFETRGASLESAVEHARDRASENLEFEEAARQHRRLDKLKATLALAPDIAGDLSQLQGVGAVRAGEQVRLYFLLEGIWQPPVDFELKSQAGESMDRRLRQLVEELPVPRPSLKEREEHLALLARWYFSSTRDSEWLPFARREDLPYRKLVRLISRAMNPVNATMNFNEAPGTH